MHFGMKDVDWAYMGALLARGNDDNQASFLKSFLKECNSWGTDYQVQQQLASINLKLTDKEREQLSMLSYKE